MNEEVAIVTGGAKGLGLGIATGLYDRRRQVIILDIDDSDFGALREHFYCIKADVTQEQSIKDAVVEVIDRYGKVDILVNNAGIIHSKSLLNILKKHEARHPYEEFKGIIDIDLNSVFLVSSIVVEQMFLKRTRGTIVNISSISARGNAGQSAYSAAKAGVEAMTVVWAKELGPLGIRVNAVAPGFIDLPSTYRSLGESTIEHIKRSTPMKRLGAIENVVTAVIQTIENDYLNGSIISVDGGLTF